MKGIRPLRIRQRLWLALLLLCVGLPGAAQSRVIPGDEQTERYFPLLEGKRIAIFSNHTGMIGDKHLLDLLLENKDYIYIIELKIDASADGH